MLGQVFFYRGMAVPKGEVITNPLDVRNPGPVANERGVYFFATQFDDERLDAQSWAVSKAQDIAGHEARVVRFPWNPLAGRILRGRVFGLYWNQEVRSNEWRYLQRLDRYIGREVVVNGAGLSSSELSKLRIEIGTRREGGWRYERFDPTTFMPEGQPAVMGERASI